KKEKNNIEQYFEVIAAVARNNFMSVSEINAIVKNIIINTFRSKYDLDANIEFIINEEEKILKLINHSVIVVDDEKFDPKSEMIEIPLSKAILINEGAKIGQTISIEIKIGTFMSLIKPQLIQSLRERKKENIYEKNKNLIGKLVEAEIININNKGSVTLKLEDGSEAFMPKSKRNFNAPLSIGQKIKVYIDDVKKFSRDFQIFVSNASKYMIQDYLLTEIPELQEKVIEIVEIARNPGERSKVAVKSNNPNVDPVGTVIGQNGSRISSVLKRMNNEKLDIIPYSEDINQFVANALEPAKVISINKTYDEKGKVKNKIVTAIVPNSHKTLAIGKAGINVKLATELTGVFIDVISLDEANEKNIIPLWNGTISKEELKLLDSGQRISKFKSGANNRNQRKGGQGKSKAKHFSDMFDSALLETKEELKNTKIHEEEFNLEIDQDIVDENFIFSDEDLKKMELAFTGFETPSNNNEGENE
ncbi:MAG: transcription termination factor NusA, partial [Mycoplasma sp.]|nr:transcription termination factor NusA [Mycoplasma sp.]